MRALELNEPSLWSPAQSEWAKARKEYVMTKSGYRYVMALSVALVMVTSVASAQTVPASPFPESVPPAYPDAALAAGIEGAVKYRATVGVDGTVKSVEILDVPAKGYGFEDVVRRTVGGWRFKPATAAGVAVESVVESAAQFTPTLTGEFVFPVTSDDAWTAMHAIARELKLGSEKLEKTEHMLVTRSVPYRDDVFPKTDALGLPPGVKMEEIQWHLAAPPGFIKARVAIAAVTVVRRSDGLRFTHYRDEALTYWIVARLAERLGHAPEALAANPSRRGLQSPPEPSALGGRECPSTPLLVASKLPTGAVPPKALSIVQPVFPRLMVARLAQAKVLVTGVLTEQGTMAELSVTSMDAPEELKIAAVTAASLWHFVPAKLDGCAALFKITVETTFRVR